MASDDILAGKKILIVDDEPDVIESIEEILEECDVEGASSYESAKELFEKKDFDAAILDIMGVDGYKLLEVAIQHNVPALMLTAHAFTPNDLVKSIKEGAASYIPKEEITKISEYLEDILKAQKEGKNTWEPWQEKLPPSYFERRWGAAWKDNDKEFWDTFKASLKSRKSSTKN